jgi:hypothetical protein
VSRSGRRGGGRAPRSAGVLEGSGSGGASGGPGRRILEGSRSGGEAGNARLTQRRPAKWEATSSGVR